MAELRSFTILEAAPGADDPVGMLMACHRRLEKRLDTLTRVIEVYQRRDMERYDQAAGAVGLVIRHFQGPTRLHHEDEELSLFPRMIAHDATASRLIAEIEFEHEKLGVQWSAMLPTLLRLAAGEEPQAETVTRLSKGVEVLVAGYEAHIRREDTELYPLALSLLSPAEIAEVGLEMAGRRQLP